MFYSCADFYQLNYQLKQYGQHFQCAITVEVPRSPHYSQSFRLSGRFSTVLLLCWAKRRPASILNSSLLLITLHVVFVYGLDYLATMAEDGLWDVFS